MFNFKNFDLGQFVKTQLAQQIQKNNIQNTINSRGVSGLSSTVSKQALNAPSKVNNGVEMGNQLNGDFIPIIYGFVGMSNTQFDQGQKPSENETNKTVQQIRIAVSEGPIAGISSPADDQYQNFYYAAYNSNNPEVLQGVVLDEKYVIDPITKVANYKDLKFRLTTGDHTGIYRQNATIALTNPATDEPVDAITDPTNTKRLNDLDDVNAGKGENYVLYWNNASGAWEAKSFNTLLNEAGASYDGGAGGSGGDGGSGGSGGKGGVGGAGGSSGEGLRYTQWNPPPVHVETTGETETTTTVTAPAQLGASFVSGKGAPLRNVDQTTPYFQTTVSASVDEQLDNIAVTTFFPDGIYKEITTVTTVKNGTITRCGTERPITDSGNLNCLTPSVEVAPNGQSSTTKTKTNGEVTVHVVFTTTLCGREFILHEGSYGISHLKRGGYKHTETFSLASMNAGRGTKEDGTQLIGSITGKDDCNAAAVEDFNFGNWTLSDYLNAYPDQIVKAANSVKVYSWIANKTGGEYSISTNCYLNAVTVCDPMSADGNYSTGSTNSSGYALNAPDHGANWQGDTSDTETDSYGMDNNRCYKEVLGGSFSDTKNPDPLLVWDHATQGSPGNDGSDGVTGTTGTTGSAGTSGSVTVPQLAPIPTVDSSNSTYAGDGTIATTSLSGITVANADSLATNTLVISIPSTAGSLDVTTVPPTVSATGRNTASLTLSGKVADLQTCLNSIVKFTSSTSALGDIAISMNISSSAGNSSESYSIRSNAQIDPVAPTFQIIVQNYVGTFDAYVRGKAIMNSITGATSNEATAQAIASAITSYTSIPNWTASAASNIVTVTGPTALGSSYNGVQPTFTGTMGAQISQIGGGVSPTRTSRPTQNTTAVRPNFVKFGSYTNGLDDIDVSWAEVVYRPTESDGTSQLSDIGLIVAGRTGLQEPIEGGGQLAMTFEEWRDTWNYNHPPTAVPDGNDDPFNLTFTSNAACVFLDYATNTRYGLGNDLKIDELPEPHRERFYRDVYEAMCWCLFYGMEADGIFFGAESKMEALQKIAALFDGRLCYVNGFPRLLFEGQNYYYTAYEFTHTPTIKKVVNQTSSANVMYSSNSLENIFNKVNVTYNDRTDLFKTKEIKLELPKNSADYPFNFDRETTLDFWGISNKYLAHFKAKWFVETETVNSETITYIAGWDHFDVLPNDLISFNDSLTPGRERLGGRVAGYDAENNVMILDRDAGQTTILFTDTSGVVSVADTDGYYAYPVAGSPIVGATWNEHDFTDLDTQSVNLYRVIAIEESEDGIYAVTAQKHDLNKYERIYAYANQF